MMRKYLLTTLLLLALAPRLPAQVDDKEVLFTFDGDTVTVGEFRRMYLKNLDQTGEGYQSPEEYLQLYIDFKLKVHEARKEGYDTMKSYRQELAKYRRQLAEPYILDPAMMDSLVREAYDHLTKMLYARHILVRVGASEDTTEAWNKIMEVRRKLLAGASFEEMARAVSDDPSAKNNGGRIGYFTAFQMVYPFERAAYALQPGELSMPVRTRFGYHLIRVDTIKPNPGEVHVAHIMIAVPRTASEAQRRAARDTIEMIWEKLQAGADFAEMAKKYSQDYGSARSGGVLPWFGPGRMISDFERAAFALREDGEISRPVRTPYGWHILKRLGHRSIGTFEEMEPQLRKKVARSDRIKYVKEDYARRLFREYGAVADTGLLERFAAEATVEKHRLHWSFPQAVAQSPVLRFREESFPFSEFYKYISHLYLPERMSVRDFVMARFEEYSRDKVLKYKQDHLEEEYPEFAALMKEYAEGILMFDIMDDKVWSKAVEDTAGLRRFYEAHKDRYMTPAKIVVKVVEVSSARDVAKVMKKVKKAVRKGRSLTTVLEKYGERVRMLPADTLIQGEDRLPAALPRKKGAVAVVDHQGHKRIYVVEDILPPQPVPLKEQLGVVTSDYQDYLEKQWLKELREKYPVKINRAVFERLKKELEAGKGEKRS